MICWKQYKTGLIKQIQEGLFRRSWLKKWIASPENVMDDRIPKSEDAMRRREALI